MRNVDRRERGSMTMEVAAKAEKELIELSV